MAKVADIGTFLAYYHANREEIDADIAAEDDVGERFERGRTTFPGKVRDGILCLNG